MTSATHRPASSLHPSIRRNLQDLDIVQVGAEDCIPGHSFGPSVRDHWLIHFIRTGKGQFQSEGRTWQLGRNDGFLICPEQVTRYEADWLDPWHYTWVGFIGTRAEEFLQLAGLSAESPVFHAREGVVATCFDAMYSALADDAGRELRLLGQLHLFLGELAENAVPESSARSARTRADYVKKALEWFRMHYARDIGVAEAAAYVGLDRSYFSELFKAEVGLAPRDFLMGLRMEKACGFMKNASLAIGDIARSVGYEDPLLFSKAFRKHCGSSPRQFRKEVQGNHHDPSSDSGNPNPFCRR